MIDPADAQAQAWLDRWTQGHATDLWNDEARLLIVKYRFNPLRASRALTYLHVTMNDAYARAVDSGLAPAGRQAALHTAASKTLSHLFPLELPGRLEAMGESALAAWAKRAPDHLDEIARGKAIGLAITHLAILRALDDGADRIWDARTRPQPDKKRWSPTPPLDSAHPQEPLAGEWRTWALSTPSEIQPPPPPPVGSDTFAAAVAEVLSTHRSLTNEQRRIAEYWHLDQGTVTPPGLWNLKARELTDKKQLSEAERVALFSTLNVAMLDASIACWKAKYTWWIPRPIALIRETLYPAFLPPLVTPPHPSYISGHAAVSGAAAEVLKSYFSTESKRIDRWAEEAAMSRLYGGIHYRFDNDAGLATGREIGRLAVTRKRASDTLARTKHQPAGGSEPKPISSR